MKRIFFSILILFVIGLMPYQLAAARGVAGDGVIIPPAQLYQIAMGLGHSGDDERALFFYLASAQKGFPPAYLAIGHVMRSEPYNNAAEAIIWYKRYVDSGYQGWGYAAALISGLYKQQGETHKALEWAHRCRQSAYKGCP